MDFLTFHHPFGVCWIFLAVAFMGWIDSQSTKTEDFGDVISLGFQPPLKQSMGTQVSFIFRGYNSYLRCNTFIFHGFGVQRIGVNITSIAEP